MESTGQRAYSEVNADGKEKDWFLMDWSDYESGYSAISRDILSDGLEYCKKMLQSYTYTFLRPGCHHSDFERGMIDARLDSLGV